ncbi:YceI family protein [Actinokineospora auranticolor]|uniref:Polyisoprenoid-binding protein YceI n=1 Tax=Actinokineospora auranticolor TaxID=155976 RepID=A0A2S6GQ21_9PSEU|nr:YceI family protein [Actinokineospora auranticolor]PPK67365.1 polyisoprenoid-binding protein YceI [Actinokineospora auranticolor]
MTLSQLPGFVAGTWDIDAAHSDVGFAVRHMVVSKVKGRFDGVSGHLVTTDDPAAASVDVVIDLNTINTYNEQRDGHLRSADFFEVETYPNLTYKATGVRADGDAYVLDGELTLKGVTKVVPLRFELNGFGPDPYGGTRVGFSGHTEINRREFGVNFEGVQNGIAVVGDKITVQIELEAVLRQG